MFKKKKSIVEIHKYTVIEVLEEIYPETNRKLTRPNVSIKHAISTVVLMVLSLGIISFGVSWGISFVPWHGKLNMGFGGRFALLYFLSLLLCIIVCSKRMVIFAIRVYQKYGPYEIRCRCLFTPSCSEYMILAIEKYGLRKGIRKGIDRFRRCHAPNGGEDYP